MRRLPLFLSGLLVLATTGCATTSHDLYLLGSIDSSGRVIGAHDAAPAGLYVRTADAQFEHRGMNYPAMLAASFDPRDPRVLYVATINGVLCSTDGGLTWRIGTSWDMTEPKSVMVDPSAPDTIYAALPNGLGVSTDRGHTWTRRETGLPARGKYTQVVTVDRTQAGRVLAGCETGIYLTDNAGSAWRRVFETTDTVNDIQQSPHDPQFWMAVTQHAGALASHDGGLTWKKIPGTPVINPGLQIFQALYNVAFDPKNPQRIAIASWKLGLLTSEDGGQTWTARNAGLPERHRVWRTAVDPDDGRLYAAVDNEALYVSADFGRTWQTGGMEKSRLQTFLFVPRREK